MSCNIISIISLLPSWHTQTNLKSDYIAAHMNDKKYCQTEEVNAVFHLIKQILLTTDYFTNVPEVYEEDFDILSLGCHTHNIYFGDFKKICDAKSHNCSGPDGFPNDQNVFGIGGYGRRFSYSTRILVSVNSMFQKRTSSGFHITQC